MLSQSVKVLVLLTVVALFVGCKPKSSFEQFVDEVNKEFLPRATALENDYKFDSYPRWDYDQSTGLLVLSNEGVMRLEANVIIAGSYSDDSRTWKWSWANETVSERARRGMLRVKEFGSARSFADLTTPEFSSERTYSWTLTCIAGHLLDAEGVYSVPNTNGRIYFLIKKIRILKEKRDK